MEKDSVINYSIILACGLGLILILGIIFIPSEESFFTEIYFENSNSLPNEVIPNEDNLFSFTVENKEELNKEYAYKVYLYLDGEKSLLEEGILNLEIGSKITKQVSFKIEEEFEQGIILITVNSEQIYFQFKEDMG